MQSGSLRTTALFIFKGYALEVETKRRPIIHIVAHPAASHSTGALYYEASSMPQIIFTSGFLWLALLRMLIAGAISVSSPTQQVSVGQDYITYLPVVTRDSIGSPPPPTTGPAE